MTSKDEGERMKVELKDTPAVSVSHLAKTYPVPFARLKRRLRRKSSTPPVEALRDVSFAVGAGEVFGLIGRNGAGKTTLAKIIATLVQPTSGTVTVCGFDSVRDEATVRAQVGLASAEERTFYWRLTVEQNLLFFARLYGMTDRRARARISELLARFELEPLARRRFGELSTGNKQRMAVARALLDQPPVLLLDEPTRSLDPLAAASMRARISSLARDTPPATVLLTSHNLAEIEELCARVAVISRGTIRALDTPRNLRELHRQAERVRLTVSGVAPARIAHLFDGDDATFDRNTATAQGDTLTIEFTREAGDDRLDRALRRVYDEGGRVLRCDAEQATLLDVLEGYEREAVANDATPNGSAPPATATIGAGRR